MNLTERERHLLSRSFTRFGIFLLEKRDIKTLNELETLEKKLGIGVTNEKL